MISNLTANPVPNEISRKPILVTGATGFIGAHIVDNLLSRGLKVRGTTRSLAKGQAMVDARPQYKGQLEFIPISDFEKSADFTSAVEGVGAIIHTASVCIHPHYSLTPYV
jgi:nucleoside-diphosphate-sugar epimerase